MNSTLPWSADDLAQLRELAAEGMAASDIAERLGRTTGAVFTALSRHRLSLRCEPRSVRERVLALVNEGWSLHRIARQHGVEIVAIQRLVATSSRPLRQLAGAVVVSRIELMPARSDTLFAHACAACGLTQREAAELVDRSYSSIQKIFYGTLEPPEEAWDKLAELFAAIEARTGDSELPPGAAARREAILALRKRARAWKS